MYSIAIDIGNTCIKTGIFKKNKLLDKLLLSTKHLPDRQKKELAGFLSKAGISRNDISEVYASSVVPSLNKPVSKIIAEITGKKAVFIDYRNFKKNILYSNPSKLGSDRIINAMAACELFGGPAIVASFGTAITFDCISGKGKFLGGMILPGIGSSLKSLHDYTEKLPFIKPENIRIPARPAGNTTEKCINNALFYGYSAAIDKILEALKKEAGKNAPVIVTGGCFLKILMGKTRYIYLPDLTLRGLNLLCSSR